MMKELSSYHQFMVRKTHAIRKRAADKALNRFERACPKLQQLCAIASQKQKWINLAEMQSAYK